METLQGKIAEILQRELGLLTRLEAVLGQEHEALSSRDTDALATNAEEKQKLIAALEAQGQERAERFKAAGLGVGKEAILAFVDAQPQLRIAWDELEATLLRCQKQNQVNGMLLEKGRQQTQQLLGILLGEANTKQTELYNARGGTSSSFSNGRSVKV